MAKSVSSAELDEGLVKTAEATRMDACSAQPTNVTEARTTFSLANVAMTAGTTGIPTTDFELADGDAANARKLRINAKTDVTITADGTANHVALSTASELLAVTTCADLPLTAGGGNTVSFPEWKREIPQPT